jgi:hypothetical protein
MRLARAVSHGHLAEAPELGGVDEEFPIGIFHEHLHLYSSGYI